MWFADFREKVSDNEKFIPLLKWILASGLLNAVCLSHIYTIPMFVLSKDTELKASLNVTLHHSFMNDFDGCDTEQAFCGLFWVRLTFFIGFAASQFSMGFLADRFGPFKLVKCMTKVLIVSGMASTISGKLPNSFR